MFRRLFPIFLLFLLPVTAVSSLRAVPRTAGLAVRIRNLPAGRAFLGEVLSWQIRKKGAGGILNRWGAYLRRRVGVSLFSDVGFASLGLDPERPLSFAYLHGPESFCVVAESGKKGINRLRLEAVLRKISGWTGVVRSEKNGGVPVRVFGPRGAGWALRYYLSGRLLVVCNSAAAVVATYNALRWPVQNIRILGDRLFRGAGVDIITGPEGLMGFFRYQLPYESFIQDNPLDGFFGRFVCGFYPASRELRLRFTLSGRPNEYLRHLAYLLRPSADNRAENGRFLLPLYASLRLHPLPFFRWVLGRLPESFQTGFYLETIRIRRKHGLSLLRDVVYNWTGDLSFALFSRGGGGSPALALRFRRPFPATGVIRFLKTSGLLAGSTEKGGLYTLSFRREIPLLGKRCVFSVRKGQLILAPDGRTHKEFQRMLERMRRGSEAFRLIFHPGRLVRILGKKKDSRSDFIAFLDGLSRSSLFTVEGGHSGRYIYIHARRRED